MYDVIRLIVDDGEWFDLKPKWARTIITCLARMGGRPVGIVASQPRHLGGILDNDSADKAARFVNLCDAFGIPLVFLVDVPGFMVGTKVEAAGIIRHGAKMLHAVASATVPKITVVLRKAYGAGYYVMNGRAYEPDLIVAWPSAEISVMGAEGAVEIVFRKQVEAAEDPAAEKAKLIDGLPRADRRLRRGGQRHDRRRDRSARDAADDHQGACRRRRQESRATVAAAWCDSRVSGYRSPCVGGSDGRHRVSGRLVNGRCRSTCAGRCARRPPGVGGGRRRADAAVRQRGGQGAAAARRPGLGARRCSPRARRRRPRRSSSKRRGDDVVARPDHAARRRRRSSSRTGTSRRRSCTSASLRASERLNREILSGLQEGVVVVDADGARGGRQRGRGASSSASRSTR